MYSFSLEIQIIDIDYELIRNARTTVFSSHQTNTPCIRLFGVTPEGHSAQVNVFGFFPYFYVNIPQETKEMSVGSIRSALEVINSLHF